MVYSCNETSDKYVAFVQGSQFGKEYEINIEKMFKWKYKENDLYMSVPGLLQT